MGSVAPALLEFALHISEMLNSELSSSSSAKSNGSFGVSGGLRDDDRDCRWGTIGEYDAH